VLVASAQPDGSPKMNEVTRMEKLETVYRLRAGICRALGHPVRLAVLDLLTEGEKSNADLLAALGVSKVNLSQHLAVMRNAGLVESRYQGREVVHRLTFEEIKIACRSISEVLVQRLEQDSRLANNLNASRTERFASPTKKG
jgi:DNA-binding transcriptional ArsR family regulator